ncbi:MAG TPA: ADP-heptose--LPS heptosyltransferase RfaF [Flavobacterium sp.]|nr:ADP-heptose--LPS heptosyltransferase RfaF [Flavobacterium sp.]
MGDVAMIVPVLRAFSVQYPNVKVTVVSRPFFKPFFDSIANVSFFSVDLHKQHKGFIGLIRLFADLKKLHTTHLADLHNVLRSKIIRFLFAVCQIKVAATNKGRAEKKTLTRLQNKNIAPLKSMIQRHAEVFENLGFPLDLKNPEFPNKASLSSETLLKLNENLSFFEHKLIGIAPFAQYKTKVYPLDLMQQLINELVKNSLYKIILFGGGKQEIDQLNQLQQNHKNVVVAAGKLSLEEELQLISNLNIMLSMDSANAHIAAMQGINVITLWGATHPFAGFTPFNQPLENCLVSNRNQYPFLPTSVYGNKHVKGYEIAMRTIEVEKIINRIRSILK